jgi:hypothetical protein
MFRTEGCAPLRRGGNAVLEEIIMRQTRLRKFAIATSTVAIAALFSAGWSVESAQAERLYI